VAVENDVMCLLCWCDAAYGGGEVDNDEGDVGTKSIDEGEWKEKRQLWNGKYMGEIEIFVMYDYSSLAQRVNERENSKRLNMNLWDENFGKWYALV